MKPKRDYQTEAIRLSKAIDIAIEAFQKNPPKETSQHQIEYFVKFYSECKEMALNSKPEYKSLASLKYIIQDVFTFFNEGSGSTVEYFWNKIEKEQLGYERTDHLAKIFDRGKIRGQTEYEFAVDIIVPYEQEGKISREQALSLGKMIGEYENRNKK